MTPLGCGHHSYSLSCDIRIMYRTRFLPADLQETVRVLYTKTETPLILCETNSDKTHSGPHVPPVPSPLPDSTEVKADNVSTVTPKEGEGDSPPSRVGVSRGGSLLDNRLPGSVGELMLGTE